MSADSRRRTSRLARRRVHRPSGWDKYAYYESAVQSPEDHVTIFDRMFHELRGRVAISLREDFCGTFLISCRWVQSHPKRTAVGVDLDPEPLNYGRQKHLKTLTPTERKRIQLLEQNVMAVSDQKFDVIGAGNFSFFVFKERQALLKYFRAAYRSLNRDGIFALELAGGAGFIKSGREQRTYRAKGLGKYTYYWDQKEFDPITHHGTYAIHFKVKNKLYRDAFTYDWRVWTIPELKEALLEAGFKEAHVYWETSDDRGEGTGEFIRSTQGENDFAWIAFVVGTK
jgi:SAM-dependent methyltransferase